MESVQLEFSYEAPGSLSQEAARREALRAYDKRRYRADPLRRVAAIKKWQIANPEKFKAMRKASDKKYQAKLKDDPIYKLRHCLRTRLTHAMRRARTKKSNGTISLLGCSAAFLRSYIEERFRPGMDWSNYGSVWHVDHVVPCAKFNLTNPHEQKLCFHWSNLRPLFGPENLKKGSAITDSHQFPLLMD